MGYSKCMSYVPSYMMIAIAYTVDGLHQNYTSDFVLAVMGKAEGSVAREEWHGHVTALSVAPEFRRLGLAAKLMEMLEEISERWV